MFFKKSLLGILCSTLFLYNSFASDKTSNKISVTADSSDPIGNMLMQSIDLIGVPYKWGGNSPDSGLDCSGFIRYVFRKSLGITLPRTAAEMATTGRKIPLNELEPGDLLFFKTSRRNHISHMGMYLGNGRFIQAPRTGEEIEIAHFNSYYRQKFALARRVVEEDINDNGETVLSDFHNERHLYVAHKKTSHTKTHKPQKYASNN